MVQPTKPSSKVFVLDTNILLSDGNAINAFEDSEVIIPLIVLEELDKHKDRLDETGRNARETARKLAGLFKSIKASQHSGLSNKFEDLSFPVGEGGTLKIVSLPSVGAALTSVEELDNKKPDNLILQYVLRIQLQEQERDVVLVSRDTLLRIKAAVLGIKTEDYKRQSSASSSRALYSGVTTIQVLPDDLEKFYSGTPVILAPELTCHLFPNEFIILKAFGSDKSGLARFIDCDKPLKKLDNKYAPFDLQERNKEQKFACDLLLDPGVQLVTLAGAAGCGKAQPLHSKILTPHGWTTMGQVKVGDIIVGSDGLPTKILGVFPQGKTKNYRVHFSDGTSAECSDQHLWNVKTQTQRGNTSSKWQTKTLTQIIEYLSGKDRHKLSIPMIEPVEFIKQEVPLDPYVLGVFLGDGNYTQEMISFSSADNEIVEKVKLLLPETCEIRSKGKYDHNICDKRSTLEKSNEVHRYNLISPNNEIVKIYSVIKFAKQNSLSYVNLYKVFKGEHKQYKGWRFSSKENYDNDFERKHQVKRALDQLGLRGHYSYEKFIPDLYKYNSIETRLKVLQGLMDTDGYVSKSGTGVNYYTTSNQLAKDVQEIVWSLGGKATIQNKQTSFTHKGIKKLGRPSFVVTISMPPNIVPFSLKRKLDRFKPRTKYLPTRLIERIEFLGEEETQCILVDAENSLYVTDNYIVTHNTLLAISAGLEQISHPLLKKKGGLYKSLVICRPMIPVGKDVGYLPGLLQEKLEPWIAPIKDNLRFLLSKGSGRTKDIEETIQLLFDEKVIQVEALTFMRGRSILGAFLILDEFQNASAHELKTVLTRAGEGTKIVLTGDIEQIDTQNLDSVTNGLSIAVEKFKPYTISGHVSLQKGERSALATLASSVL